MRFKFRDLFYKDMLVVYRIIKYWSSISWFNVLYFSMEIKIRVGDLLILCS